MNNTVNIHLRVLDANKKSKFTHYNLAAVPTFRYPEELKSFLLDKHTALIAPADNLNFAMGYIVEGKGNQKYSIVDSATLKQAYSAVTSGRVCLWVDPHVPEGKKTEPKKAAKRPGTDISTANDNEETKRQRREAIMDELKYKHGDKWPAFKLRCWATMVSYGTHQSLDDPPKVGFFRTSSEKGKTSSTTTNTVTKTESRGALLRQLKDLSELKKDGILDDIQFNTQKDNILKDLQSL